MKTPEQQFDDAVTTIAVLVRASKQAADDLRDAQAKVAVAIANGADVKTAYSQLSDPHLDRLRTLSRLIDEHPQAEVYAALAELETYRRLSLAARLRGEEVENYDHECQRLWNRVERLRRGVVETDEDTRGEH